MAAARQVLSSVPSSSPTPACAACFHRSRKRFNAPRTGRGRKNFLFVGHAEAGENIAGLYSLVATCEANGVNNYEYLRDVLLRVSIHPASRIDELVPDQWRPAQTA